MQTERQLKPLAAGAAATPTPMASSGERMGNAAAAAGMSAVRGMNAWERHKHFLHHYTLAYGDRDGSLSQQARQPARTDFDSVREEHRFLWDNVDGRRAPAADSLSWEQRLAKRYHDQLFKEFALADMSRYREGAVGLRWRTEKEVVEGRGQFSCGNKACNRTDVALTSYELHFGYSEHGEAREALVKVRCCEECAGKLSYRRDRDRQREERKRAKKEAKSERKRRKKRPRRGDSHGDSSGSGSDEKECAGGAGTAAAKEQEAPAPAPAPDGAHVWLEQPALHKSRGEEFDAFFDEYCGDLFA